MPIITIIPAENAVYIDRDPVPIDCSDLVDEAQPELRVHAVQWNGKVGWIEYENDPFDNKNFVPNRDITDIEQFQKYVDQWPAAKAEMERKAEEERQKWAAFRIEDNP